MLGCEGKGEGGGGGWGGGEVGHHDFHKKCMKNLLYYKVHEMTYIVSNNCNINVY